ncbi:MAG TPA: HAD family phosphatase [Thermomicrobiaceae bacterium]|nr:HAD family phosphatase [Thermomicrobiaceae bacterium]
MLEAVLFDMDGVLADSEGVHAAALDDVLAAHGLPPATAEDYARFLLGKTDRTGLADYLRARADRPLDLEALLKEKATAFARRFPAEVHLFPDGVDTLRVLAARGYRVAIASGGLEREIAMVVDLAGLAPVLSARVSGEEVPDGKPSPAPYLLAAARLGVAPPRCVVVEDAPAGVAAAKAAGMRCLAVDRVGRPEWLAAADQVVAHLTPEAVEALGRQVP